MCDRVAGDNETGGHSGYLFQVTLLSGGKKMIENDRVSEGPLVAAIENFSSKIRLPNLGDLMVQIRS